VRICVVDVLFIASMSLEKYIERANYIDHLIRSRATGTPKELAVKTGVSERQIYNIINALKEMGAPVEFCNVIRSYIYTSPCRFEIGFRLI
jgi:predicted DNA-binding transcriptional regulator YafY